MSIHTVADDGTNQAFTFSPQQPTTNEEIDVSGAGRFALAIHHPVYPMAVSVNLAPGTQATGEFHLEGKNYLRIVGDASTSLTDNITSNFAAANVIIQPAVLGTGQMLVGADGELEIKSSVADGISIGLNAAILKLDSPSTFKGLVNFTGSEVVLAGLGNATDFSLSNGILSIYGGAGDQVIDTLRFSDLTPASTGLTLRIDNQGSLLVTEQGMDATTTPAGGIVSTLTQHVAPSPAVVPPVAAMPPLPPNSALRSLQALIFDTTTNAYNLDLLTHPYLGPVAGVRLETILVTPDSLNITRISESMFIKTGAGNDAIALSSGTNVVDAGGGSNFLTSGTGFDTFFLDARNIPPAASAAGPVPGAIWDTIANFGHGDAATLWGISPGTALVWQKNEGAVGHTGLTLHANMPNGSEASLTLAGIDSKAGLSLSYGSSDGSSYLYVKAV